MRLRPRASGRLGNGPLPGLFEGNRSEQGRCEEGDRNLDEEDRLPGDEFGQEAPDPRTECRADRPSANPECDSLSLGPPGRDQQLERGGNRQCATDRLHDPSGEEGAESRSEPAGEAAPREYGEPDCRCPARAEPTGGDRPGNGYQGEGEVEADQDPGDPFDRGLELPEDLRQGEYDYRRVREDQGDTDQEGSGLERPQ